MPIRYFFIASLMALSMWPVKTAAQDKKNEVSFTAGSIGVGDQNVSGTNLPNNTLHFGDGITFEANYSRWFRRWDALGLAVEVPVAINPDEDLQFGANLIPESYYAYFITPSIRAQFVPTALLSPWVSVGAGLGHFTPSSNLEFYGKNSGSGKTVSVFQIGGGFDVRIWKSFKVRGEVRDFNSGVPPLNVNTGKSRQGNLFSGGGIVWMF
ncbi:MAG: outer membrane beta-barrel protein [Acidobacteriales bacterium]|nr:outer membrane beta-barrel protein [Terriglobales bacterium]